MKKIFALFLLLFSFSFLANSQNKLYAPLGTKWTHSSSSWSYPQTWSTIFASDCFASANFIQDSLHCTKLKFNTWASGSKPFYQTLCQGSNDKVYILNEQNGDLHLYYDLRGDSGDTWKITIPFIKSNRRTEYLEAYARITKKQVFKIDSQLFYGIKFNVKYGAQTFSDTLSYDAVNNRYRINKYEIDSSRQNLFIDAFDGLGTFYHIGYKEFGLLDYSSTTNKVRCIHHPQLGTAKFEWTKDCYYSNVGMKEKDQKQKINLYPNPVNNILTISLPVGMEAIELSVFSSSGQLLLTEKLSSYENSVDVSIYAKGLYFYRIENNGVLMQQGKLLKE